MVRCLRVVVVNVNTKTTLLDLIGEEHLDKEYAEYIKKLRTSPSAFMVSLGVYIDFADYPTIIKNLGEDYRLIINSNADSPLSPKGMASLTIITLANYHDSQPRRSEEYMKKRKEVVEILIEKIKKVIPESRKILCSRYSNT